MTQELTDKFAWYGDNGYYFNNNMWGMDSGSGYQVTRVESTQPDGVVWHVDWNWNGGDNNVKSYPYSGRELPTKRLIRDIQSLPSSASWTYSGPNVRANVAFDLFTASDPEHENWHGDYELMIWLSRQGGVHPIGQVIARASIAGIDWELYEGKNGNMHVYTFVAVTERGDINLDVKHFFNHISLNNGFPAESQYLITFQFGTEPFTGGPARFAVKHWSGDVVNGSTPTVKLAWSPSWFAPLESCVLATPPTFHREYPLYRQTQLSVVGLARLHSHLQVCGTGLSKMVPAYLGVAKAEDDRSESSSVKSDSSSDSSSNSFESERAASSSRAEPSNTTKPVDPRFMAHLDLLGGNTGNSESVEVSTTPIFTEQVRQFAIEQNVLRTACIPTEKLQNLAIDRDTPDHSRTPSPAEQPGTSAPPLHFDFGFKQKSSGAATAPAGSLFDFSHVPKSQLFDFTPQDGLISTPLKTGESIFNFFPKQNASSGSRKPIQNTTSTSDPPASKHPSTTRSVTQNSSSQEDLKPQNDPSTPEPFTQYGLLAGDVGGLSLANEAKANGEPAPDPRLFYNIAAPSSVFICGSQGSGKSHTLGCLLENCLVPSMANSLPRPLTGIVFHYDTFTSDTSGSACEAAYLSSAKGVSVRVLCAPTNVGHIKRIYEHLPNVAVEELRINQSDLNTQRMLNLMAISSVSGGMPLYLHVVVRILRDLRIHQQNTKTTFDYGMFKRLLDDESLTEGQSAPLKQRLETLESFMVQTQADSYKMAKQRAPADGKNKSKNKSKKRSMFGNEWTPQAGRLTIVDLSCPCVTAEMACSLFGMCLSLFLEQSTSIGRVVALDEAHKYMTDSAECQALTESLLSTIRLQRHLATRIIISTQEPTISPKLLDLCSVTIVHRFTSPDWLETLKRHLAGAWSSLQPRQTNETFAEDEDDHTPSGVAPLTLDANNVALDLFSRIVALRTGEALLFAPSAVTGIRRKVARENGTSEHEIVRLGHGVLKVRVRQRVTQDGGKSKMAI